MTGVQDKDGFEAGARLSPGRIKRLRARLLSWYDQSHRDLPWRLSPPDPYRVLVSEFMLQQTQVKSVIPYFERFTARFPSVKALAAADLEDVLPLWAGLGYYRRCHHLHAAAREIVEEWKGEAPSDLGGLSTLPGVGRYTAGAIASIAFGRRCAAVDGNVSRVVRRVLGLAATTPESPAHRNGTGKVATAFSLRVYEETSRWVPRDRPGDFNQALMELGATICLPRRPACERCPIRFSCQSVKALGRLEQRERPAPERRFEIGKVASARPQGGGGRGKRSLLLVAVAIEAPDGFVYQKRPEDGLWAGLWEWPTQVVGEEGRPSRANAPTQEADEQVSKAGRALVDSFLPGRRLRVRHVGGVVHELTHRRVRVELFHTRLAGGPDALNVLRHGTKSEIRVARPATEGMACSALQGKVEALLA